MVSSNSLAADTGLLTSAESEVYRSVSRAAVVSLVLSVLGISAFMAPQLSVLPMAGLLFGVAGLRAIKRYPEEVLGRPMAIAGTVLSGCLLFAAPAYHGYVYSTEVPEGYSRVSFFNLMADKNQPDVPTEIAAQWNGRKVFIKGYVHPSSMDSATAKKFIIVPDLGTCCFGGQPPLTHMIEVTLTGDQYAHRNLRKKGLAGTFSVNPYLKPVDGLTGVYYQLRAEIIR